MFAFKENIPRGFLGISSFFQANNFNSNSSLSDKCFFSSSKRLNKGFKEFEGQNRAFIIRFRQDNSYIALDYRSPSILDMDLVERLGLQKNDKVMVRCLKGDFEGKIWFLGTKEEVSSQEKEAERIMRRVEEGEIFNISDISLCQGSAVTEKERTVDNQVFSSQNQDMSDCESECLEPPSKRISLDSTCNRGESTNSNAASLAALVCFYCFFFNFEWSFSIQF